MISTHLYFYEHILNEMGICLWKEREKPKHLKPTFFKLLKEDETIINQFEDAIIQK
jgi:hypothetical protein